ncbi:hypothetical protein M3C61_06075 [Dermacoccus abyssi]|uniref:hypothetical protein n=1 Tax=Dermacoccus abyssi TaxID=322596 RepID=UPI0021A7F397|nr:hypothetical protein [Dermacoccus abyssi]MCT1986592.1 hypothetical protein [Dermacoccus abyssi]
MGYEIVDERPFSDRLVLVAVRWTFFDANGDALTDSSPSYLLRREDSGLRATVCIQTDDMEKLQALAESRGVDLASRSEQLSPRPAKRARKSGRDRTMRSLPLVCRADRI